MDFLALNDDVKFIISKHLASDLKIRVLLSKNHDLQKNNIWYVCMHVCMHACMHACMYVYMYVCMYVCMYVMYA